MLHIHTRWQAVVGDWKLSESDAVKSLDQDPNARPWGNMWLTHRTSPPDREYHMWHKRGLEEKAHFLAMYETFSRDTDIRHAIGVASPHPVDTACFIEDIYSELNDRFGDNPPISPIHVNLSMDALNAATKAITSVRIEDKECSTIQQFHVPHHPSDIPDRNYACVGMLLEHSGNTALVNLFEDGQFYVANADQAEIGWIAHELMTLWMVGVHSGE